MDTQTTIKGSMASGLALGAFVIFACIAIVYKLWGNYLAVAQVHNEARFVLAACTLLVAAGVAYLLNNLLAGSTLRIDQEGLATTNFRGRHFVPWPEVQRIEWSMHSFTLHTEKVRLVVPLNLVPNRQEVEQYILRVAPNASRVQNV